MLAGTGSVGANGKTEDSEQYHHKTDIQRLYPLEVSSVNETDFLVREKPKFNNVDYPKVALIKEADLKSPVYSRAGRRVKQPTKMSL